MRCARIGWNKNDPMRSGAKILLKNERSFLKKIDLQRSVFDDHGPFRMKRYIRAACGMQEALRG